MTEVLKGAHGAIEFRCETKRGCTAVSGGKTKSASTERLRLPWSIRTEDKKEFSVEHFHYSYRLNRFLIMSSPIFGAVPVPSHKVDLQ